MTCDLLQAFFVYWFGGPAHVSSYLCKLRSALCKCHLWCSLMPANIVHVFVTSSDTFKMCHCLQRVKAWRCQSFTNLSNWIVHGDSLNVIEHWQGRVLSQPSGNVLLLGARILDVMSPCDSFFTAFQSCLHALDKLHFFKLLLAFFMLFTIVGALGCWNLMSTFCNHHHPTNPAPGWNHHASHLSNKSCYCALSSNKVGGSGRQSLTRLSTHMNVP